MLIDDFIPPVLSYNQLCYDNIFIVIVCRDNTQRRKGVRTGQDFD